MRKTCLRSGEACGGCCLILCCARRGSNAAMSKRSDFRGPVRCRESLRFTAKWRATVFLAGLRRTGPVCCSRIMKISAMNSGGTPNRDQSTIDTTTMTMTPPNRLLSDWRISVVVLIALWAVIYMAGLSRAALLDDADTVHAEAAREMVQRHDWVTLYANGIRYLEKAPLMYWGVATSYVLFGVHDWSTRLPQMLGILACLLAAYALRRYAYAERGGL